MELTLAQKQIVTDDHRFRVVCCGRRFGKTTLAIWEMLGVAVSRQHVKVCYVAPTFQQARDIAWQELKKVCQPVALNVNESRLEITVQAQDGGTSTIWLRGWESVETLRGQRFNFVVLDEVAGMKNFWASWQEVIRPTLTDERGAGLFISTPKGFNHFYDLFNLKVTDPDYQAFHFTSYDNPHVPADELDKAKQELTEDRFAQEYLADFRKTEGLVYKEFDRAVHVITDLPKGTAQVRRLVGIDWGFTNPAAVLNVVEDQDRRYYVMGEWYQAGKTTEEIVDLAASFQGNAYYPDPAEPDRIAELKKRVRNVQEVSKDVEAGIDAVRALFKNHRLFIHEGCRNLISELETYTYRESVPGSNLPEGPIKDHDHALDALRYVLYMVGSSSQDRVAPVTFTPSSFPYRRQTLNPL